MKNRTKPPFPHLRKAQQVSSSGANRHDGISQYQIKKFEAAARELGVDESPDEFDKVMRELAKKPPAPREKSKKDKT